MKKATSIILLAIAAVCLVEGSAEAKSKTKTKVSLNIGGCAPVRERYVVEHYGPYVAPAPVYIAPDPYYYPPAPVYVAPRPYYREVRVYERPRPHYGMSFGMGFFN